MSRAVVLEAPGRLAVRAGERPAPGAGEVVVRVAWAGICGSDVDLHTGRRPPAFARYPVVPGHEWSGTVEVAGDGVAPDLVGRAVVGENIRPCRACSPCRRGDAPACEVAYEETGFTLDGAWADHLVIPAHLLHRLAPGADLRSAAGLEPAACAAEAIRRAGIAPGDHVAIVGGGTIGLLATQLARAAGAGAITVVDPNTTKAALAERSGATTLVAPAEAQVGRFDIAIEAAGVVGSTAHALSLLRRGGRLVVCGIPPAEDALATTDLVTKGVRVETVFGAPSRAWRDAVEAFGAGHLDPGLLVTHELDLAEAATALDLVASGAAGVGKVLLRP